MTDDRVRVCTAQQVLCTGTRLPGMYKYQYIPAPFDTTYLSLEVSVSRTLEVTSSVMSRGLNILLLYVTNESSQYQVLEIEKSEV
jgi:hypothetical protein